MNEQMLKAKKKGDSWDSERKKAESLVVKFCFPFLMHFGICFHFLVTTITQVWNLCKDPMTNALRNQQKSKTFQQVFPLVCNPCLAFKWIKYLQRKSSYFFKGKCNLLQCRKNQKCIERYFQIFFFKNLEFLLVHALIYVLKFDL